MIQRLGIIGITICLSVGFVQWGLPLLRAQSPTAIITVNTTVTVADTGGGPINLTCTITASPAKTFVISACTNGGTALPSQAIDVSQPGEAVTYALNIGGNSVSVILSQSSPIGTLSYQVAGNGVQKSGAF